MGKLTVFPARGRSLAAAATVATLVVLLFTGQVLKRSEIQQILTINHREDAGAAAESRKLHSSKKDIVLVNYLQIHDLNCWELIIWQNNMSRDPWRVADASSQVRCKSFISTPKLTAHSSNSGQWNAPGHVWPSSDAPKSSMVTLDSLIATLAATMSLCFTPSWWIASSDLRR
jgi:hypothetical protein